MKYDIFISYRRDGGDTLSQLIYDRLTHRGYRVFLDIESLNAGKFNEKLLEVIEECKDIVVVLPPNGLDRCNNAGDWLYRELEHGIKHGKNIVPVLMKDFEWPEKIPDEIAEIKNYNGIVDNKDYFDAVIDKLTTLLKSKPVIGGKILGKVGERGHLVKNRVKKQKRTIAIILVMVFLCIAAYFLLKNIEKQKREDERLNAKIKLIPSEEMSASEYYDAIKILKERINILADGSKYSFEESEGNLYITIPQEVFHDVEIETTLKCYVTRPTEIYLTGHWPENTKDEDKYFHIERSQIESMKLVDDAPVDVDFESYVLHGVESEDDCQYFAMTVNEEVAREAREWIERTKFDNYGLYQDCEEFGKAYYYDLTGIFEKDNTLYFVDNYQYDNYLNLILYNYQNETFSKPFYFMIETPVTWEYDDTKGELEPFLYGKNQCNVDELSSELIARYDFETWNDEFTEGEYKDIVIAFKKRLDSIGIPYAFGTYTTDPYHIVVKMDPNYMNSIIQEYIGSTNKISIQSKFYEILDYTFVEEISICGNEDDTYSMVIIPREDWISYHKDEKIKELAADEEIFLCIADYPGIPVSVGTLADSFDGGRFVFNNLSIFGIEKLSKENKYFAEFLKELHETKIPANYTLKGRYGEFEEESICQVISDPTFSEEVEVLCDEAIRMSEIIKECNVEVDCFGQRVSFEIICPEDMPYVDYVNEAFQELYDYCKMDEGKISTIYLNFYYGSSKGKYTRFVVNKNIYDHCMEFSAYYDYEESKEVKDEFDKLFNTDSFYEQFGISSIYIDEEYISFQL